MNEPEKSDPSNVAEKLANKPGRSGAESAERREGAKGNSNGSAIIGEAGSQIGRGARTSLFIVDESAFLEAPELAEASLSATTDTRIDISSVNGLNNPFARKRFSGKVPVFTAHWRQDPRKDDAWYRKKCSELPPAVVASEIDLDYQGSVEGQLLPSAWIQAAIGAAARLRLPVTGNAYGAFDVGDEGRDRCAFAMRRGIELQYLRQWSGKGSDRRWELGGW